MDGLYRIKIEAWSAERPTKMVLSLGVEAGVTESDVRFFSRELILAKFKPVAELFNIRPEEESLPLIEEIEKREQEEARSNAGGKQPSGGNG